MIMKTNKRTIIFSLIAIVAISALYRVIPSRPFGFAPQLAIAIFSGALFVKDKKWAFALPLLSMLLSDVLYQVLYINGASYIQGFYGSEQVVNYVLFTLITCIGFFIGKMKVFNIAAASLVAPTVYFIVSNFLVWVMGSGWHHPHTFAGLIWCYSDAIPFYQMSISSTVLFSAILFGGYYALNIVTDKKKVA